MKDKKLYLTNKREGSICEVRRVAYKIDGSSNTYVEVRPRLNPEKFIPCREEKYWSIDSYGEIKRFYNMVQKFTDYRMSIGNCFQDKLHAETYLKVRTAMLQLAKEYPVDWEYTNDKYYILWDCVNSNIRIDCWQISKSQHEIYYSCKKPDKKLCERGITKEELEWYCKREV